MKTTLYEVTGKSGANLRELPSTDSKVVETLKTGAEVEVVQKITATNTNGTDTVYFLCKCSGKYLWAAAKNLQKKTVDYQRLVKLAAKEIYPTCIGKTHGVAVQKKVKTLAQFYKYKEVNCNIMVDATLWKAGLLPEGCVISHTAKSNGKTYIGDAVKGTENLKHCRLFWVNKPYDKLPDRWKEAGIIYVQNSNICVSMGKGHVYSCNKSVGYKYKSQSDYDRTSGYPVESLILVVIVPNK